MFVISYVTNAPKAVNGKSSKELIKIGVKNNFKADVWIKHSIRFYQLDKWLITVLFPTFVSPNIYIGAANSILWDGKFHHILTKIIIIKMIMIWVCVIKEIYIFHINSLFFPADSVPVFLIDLINSVFSYSIIQQSTLLPDPMSLIIPASIARTARSIASYLVIFGLYWVSSTDYAANDPLPSVAYGKWSYDPCGAIATKWNP